MKRNFKIENFVQSVSPLAQEAAREENKQLPSNLEQGGFQLPKKICNSENVMREMALEKRYCEQCMTFEDVNISSSILRLQWNVKSHSLYICPGMRKVVPAKATQKKMVSQVAFMFDQQDCFSVH